VDTHGKPVPMARKDTWSQAALAGHAVRTIYKTRSVRDAVLEHRARLLHDGRLRQADGDGYFG